MRVILGSIAAIALTFVAQVAVAEDAKTLRKDTKEATAQNPATAAKAATPAPKRAPQQADVAVGAALARLDDAKLQSGLLPSSGAPASAPAPRSGGAPAVMPTADSGGLADIHVGHMEASDHAGKAREVTLVAVAPGTKTPKPVATVRMQRKMGVDRTMASLAPAFEACRAHAPAGTAGTVAAQLDVAPTGRIEHVETTTVRGSLGNPTAACVGAAFAAATFAAPGGLGATLTVPVTLGQNRGDVTQLAIPE